MIQQTMTRQQLFQLGNLDWATTDELTRAKNMKAIYNQLTTEKQLTFIEQFDKYLQMNTLIFIMKTDLLLDSKDETEEEK